MDQLAAHQRAQDVFADILANVKSDQLDAPSPCSAWNAKAVIDHVITGNLRVAQLGGRDPETLPDELEAAHTLSAVVAQDTFAAPDGLTRTYTLPFGELPGTGFIGLRTIDAFAHAWDLAKATGQSSDLDPDLAVLLLSVAKERMSPAFRGPARPFAEEQPCAEGSPAADALAAFLGRTAG
jgi:uncharacterized protein (TIGR03086 family)